MFLTVSNYLVGLFSGFKRGDDGREDKMSRYERVISVLVFAICNVIPAIYHFRLPLSEVLYDVLLHGGYSDAVVVGFFSLGEGTIDALAFEYFVMYVGHIVMSTSCTTTS